MFILHLFLVTSSLQVMIYIWLLTRSVFFFLWKKLYISRFRFLKNFSSGFSLCYLFWTLIFLLPFQQTVFLSEIALLLKVQQVLLPLSLLLSWSLQTCFCLTFLKHLIYSWGSCFCWMTLLKINYFLTLYTFAALLQHTWTTHVLFSWK